VCGELSLRRGVRYLQVALDFTSLEEALRLLRALGDLPDNLIIEIGTPLVKSAGVFSSVKSVRGVVGGDRLVLADMKTMDVGYVEAQLAFSSGADLTTVLGVADDETVRGALRAAEEWGRWVQADLIGHPNPVARARELADLGVHVVGVHAGIDVQSGRRLRAIELSDLVYQLRREVGDRALLSVAGGVKPGEVKALADKGADIVVIGAAIAKSPSPREALLEALRGLG